jgi:hypothetical protein
LPPTRAAGSGPAPADKGTELGARLRGPVPTGPAEVGASLGETQWLLEAGEVLQYRVEQLKQQTRVLQTDRGWSAW